MEELIREIRKCAVCQDLPLGANPVVQLNPDSKIIIIGQAPGRAVHNTGIPWNDRSGDTLRNWLGVEKEDFYDDRNFSIMGMGFCYPGKGNSGDLPPRPECSKLWHPPIISYFPDDVLTILIGQYAQRSYLQKKFMSGLTETVRHYEEYLPKYFVLPHPSPRNQNWVKTNPWFTGLVLPRLKNEVRSRLIKD